MGDSENATASPDVAVVFGTLNRLPLLKRAVESIRRAAGGLSVVSLVADGNSQDGTREWLADQPDCVLLEGGRDGAVKAFNVGFARAVDLGVPYVSTFNDDDEFVHQPVDRELEVAVGMLAGDVAAGGVAFEMNTRGRWMCEEWAGQPYGNTCLVRREVGMAVARAQGDLTGKAWWDVRFHTYASDTVFGIWVTRLGWKMVRGTGLRVRDYSHPDDLRKHNLKHYTNDGTSRLFSRQFGSAAACAYSRADAERFGGRIR